MIISVYIMDHAIGKTILGGVKNGLLKLLYQLDNPMFVNLEHK